MGALNPPEYESLEMESPEKATIGSETTAGAVKHNGLIGLVDKSPARASGVGQVNAQEPAATMADEMYPQADSNSEAAAVLPDHNQLLVNALMGKTFEEKPIWATLWESIQDVFFPRKLPPLVLTSTPIDVPDRMAVKPNPWAIGISTTVNLTILLIVLFFLGKKIIDTVNKPATITTTIDVGDFDAAKAAKKNGGGGGGGDRSIIDASKGKLPKIEPKIAMPAAIDVQKDIKLPDNPNLPDIGMKSGVNIVLSNGTGSGGGMGSGSGGGLGSGNGIGYGPGSGWNTGGGLAQVGGRVSAPVPLFQPEAEFSDEARRAKYQGVCLVGLIVDAQGNPQNVHIVRPLGMGLDEKAMEAVRKYKFKPAMRDGKTPVPVYVNVEVNFRLY